MVKADDKEEYEDTNGKIVKEKYSHFEELQKKVEILTDVVNEHADILRENNLIRTEKIVAPYFDSDEVYKQLEEESENSADN